MIFLLLFILPMAVALAAEYLVCRIPKSRVWRILPPAALILGGLAALWGRCRGWGDGPVPVEALFFFPGVPVLGMALGLFLGWRLWGWLWRPRIVKDGK